MNLDTLAVALVSQLLHHVARKGRSVHDVIGRVLCFKHREALVVTGCKADVPCARSLDGADPLSRIKLSRIETASQFFILIVSQVTVSHCPLARSEHSVKSPMEEDAEFVITEFSTRLQVLLRRRITTLSPQSRPNQHRCKQRKKNGSLHKI